LEEVLKSSKDLHIAYLDLGILYANQKQYRRAVSMLKEAIRLDPTRPEAHYRLAQTYRSMGRNQDMEAELKQVKQLHNKSNEEFLHKISGPPPAPKME